MDWKGWNKTLFVDDMNVYVKFPQRLYKIVTKTNRWIYNSCMIRGQHKKGMIPSIETLSVFYIQYFYI